MNDDVAKPEKKPVPMPAFYSYVWLALVIVGREHGYAMGLHGSMARDLDVVAVPWTDGASDAETLVRACIERVGYLLPEKHPELADRPEHQMPSVKPHGRRAWSIHMDHGYVDLSVMPRVLP